MNELNSLSALVLEDEFIIAMDLQDMLVDWGFGRVAVAHDAGEARTALAKERPHVLVADYQLGTETSDDLILEAHANGTAVVVLTGRSLDPAALERIGNPRVIEKPVQPNALREMLLGLLERS